MFKKEILELEKEIKKNNGNIKLPQKLWGKLM
jgi:hypothetical protein